MPPPPATTPAYRTGTGPRAVFLHANGFPPTAYRPFLDALGSGLDITAYATRPLLRPELQPIPWRTLADDVLSLQDEPVVAIGHSMGATALALAAPHYADRLTALVLIEPAMVHRWQSVVLGLSPTSLVDRIGPSGPTRRKRDTWATATEFRESCRRSGLYDGLTEAAMDAFVEAALHPTPTGVTLAFPKRWEAHFYTTPPGPPTAALGRLGTPLVAIRGKPSIFLDDARWRATLAKRPDAHRITLPSLGHLAPLEGPDAVAHAVLTGLEALGVPHARPAGSAAIPPRPDGAA